MHSNSEVSLNSGTTIAIFVSGKMMSKVVYGKCEVSVGDVVGALGLTDVEDSESMMGYGESWMNLRRRATKMKERPRRFGVIRSRGRGENNSNSEHRASRAEWGQRKRLVVWREADD
ncbi:hypothetical protein Tco_0790802 [Tanacetum coccineum]